MQKKSFYILMTSLLGIMLFLILDRVVVFLYLYLIGTGYIGSIDDLNKFLLWDYFVLAIVMLLGAWYGIWLGLGWYGRVYEEKMHGGFADHFVKRYWPNASARELDVKIEHVREKLEKNLTELESLAESSMSKVPKQKTKVVRRTVRKRIVSK